jgi:hypothetical protein
MKPETSVGTSAQAEGLLGGDTARMRALAEYLGHWRAMSVDAVRAACNQSSSREPIVDYDEEVVHQTLRSLKDWVLREGSARNGGPQ